MCIPHHSDGRFYPSLIFRWLAIPWIQSELDKWVLHRNRTRPRYDKKKVLPNGIPLVIRDKPEKFDAMDFKVGANFFRSL